MLAMHHLAYVCARGGLLPRSRAASAVCRRPVLTVRTASAIARQLPINTTTCFARVTAV
jgi:hypothetical protein